MKYIVHKISTETFEKMFHLKYGSYFIHLCLVLAAYKNGFYYQTQVLNDSIIYTKIT